MKRGPESGAVRPDKVDFVEGARRTWPAPCPDWVLELAKFANVARLKKAGERIGYSGSLVSQVLSHSYDGDIEKVRQKVMGALMGETVTCPGMGRDMSRKTCLDWQDKPKAETSSLRTAMYRACRAGCPHFRKGASDE